MTSPRDPPDAKPAPPGLWTAVQAAVTGGWGATARLIVILLAIAVVLLLLRAVGATTLAAIAELLH